MKAILWTLTILLAALGGVMLIENVSNSYDPGRPLWLYMGLVFLLTAVAIYTRKLHRSELARPSETR
jgi:hypothetical protein